MSLVLRLRKADDPSPRVFPLDPSYTLDDVQQAINAAEQYGQEVTLLGADGSFIEFDPRSFTTPPASMAVTVANLTSKGTLQ